MVFAAVSRDSGWTSPGTSLAKRIYTAMKSVGNAALIGISNDIPSTSHIPTAYQEADTALEHASVSERVVRFIDIPLRRLLLHFAAQNLGRVLPAWASAFFDADDKSNGALLATLRAYARGDTNILKAADDLGIHPNTVYARLQRVFDISGLQPRSCKGLCDLLIVGEFDRGGALKAAGRR